MANKRKIVIIGPAYPYRGGPSTFVSYIYKTVKNRFDVVVYNYKLLYPSFLFPGTTQFDKSKEKKFIIPNERIVNSINPFNWLMTSKKLKQENADLVVFDWWHPFFGPCHFSISGLVKNRYKGKILFITENYISHEQNRVDKILTRIGLNNADSFMALSEIVEKELKVNFPGKKIYRSELPSFDLFSEDAVFERINERKELGFKPEDKVLLFFGYVRKYKGLDVLIEALPGILNKIPEAKLLIVGEFYDSVSNYSELIERLKLSDKIKLINEFVPNEKVGKFFAAADLAILPYRSATQSAVLNVSYSFNMPVVVTNVGGLSEFVEDRKTGIIIQPGKPEEIVKGVLEYFELKNKIDFRKNIEEFKNRNNFKNLAGLFEQVIEETGK
ncbi:MAG: glycosyltransferase [Ignavibacteriaceae bacterium]